MTAKDRLERIRIYQKEQSDIMEIKGADYSGGKESEDANSNFKEVARRLKGAPMNELTVWMVYLEKHIISLETFIKTLRIESEELSERLNDVVNYANIGRTLLEEREKGYDIMTKPSPQVPILSPHPFYAGEHIHEGDQSG